MTDWPEIARALNTGLTTDQANRAAQALGPLESAFRPLLKNLSPGDEPAATFTPEAPQP